MNCQRMGIEFCEGRGIMWSYRPIRAHKFQLSSFLAWNCGWLQYQSLWHRYKFDNWAIEFQDVFTEYLYIVYSSFTEWDLYEPVNTSTSSALYVTPGGNSAEKYFVPQARPIAVTTLLSASLPTQLDVFDSLVSLCSTYAAFEYIPLITTRQETLPTAPSFSVPIRDMQ